MNDILELAIGTERPRPPVSIGMPVFNGESFIRQALDSLLAQTFTDFELIISDNASTDRTEEICLEYARHDARIYYIKQTNNLGAYANFKFVLDAAVGRYFMWAAADDLWDNQFIYENYIALENSADANLSFALYEIKSIYLPFLKLVNFKHMKFLEVQDKFERFSKFLHEEEPSHKANALYGLWRIESALDIMKYLISLKQNVFFGGDKSAIIRHIVLNKAYQVPLVLFYKRYKYLPSGHPIDVVVKCYQRFSKSHRDRIAHAFQVEADEIRNIVVSNISGDLASYESEIGKYHATNLDDAQGSFVKFFRKSMRRAVKTP